MTVHDIRRWFWLGYIDESKPKGERSMGCVITKAATDDIAMECALEFLSPLVELHWTCGVGEIDSAWGDPPPGYANRLLTTKEAEELAKAWDPEHRGLASPDQIREAFLDDDAELGEPLFRVRS